MPTRRGSIQLAGAAAPVEDSAMRAVDVGAAVEGRDSFGEEDDDDLCGRFLDDIDRSGPLAGSAGVVPGAGLGGWLRRCVESAL